MTIVTFNRDNTGVEVGDISMPYPELEPEPSRTGVSNANSPTVYVAVSIINHQVIIDKLLTLSADCSSKVIAFCTVF